jgi:hypothetical protein
VWHINVTAKTDGQMQAAVYNSRHPWKSEGSMP